MLFESVRGQIFSLPDTTLLFTGHDYQVGDGVSLGRASHIVEALLF